MVLWKNVMQTLDCAWSIKHMLLLMITLILMIKKKTYVDDKEYFQHLIIIANK